MPEDKDRPDTDANKQAADAGTSAGDKPADVDAKKTKPDAADTKDTKPKATAAPDAEPDAAADANAEGATAATKPKKKKSSLLPWIAAGVAGVLLIAAVAVAIWAYLQYKNLDDEKTDANDASQQACAYAGKLATYDFNNLDAFFQGVLSGATGEAKQRFDETSKSNDLKDFLKQAQVKSQVDGAECGVKSVNDDDTVNVVISITGKQGSLGTQGQLVPRQIGVLATMQNVDGQWLVSKLDAPFLQPAG